MYSIVFTNNAANILQKIHKTDFKLYSRLVNAIEVLCSFPYRGKKLKGFLKNDYSLRIGTHRIIYTIHKGKLIIYIIDIGHRKDIYR